MCNSLRSVFLSLLICFLFNQDTQPSNLFSFAGMCTARTLADVSIIPMALGLSPVRSLQNLLHSKLGPQESEHPEKKNSTKPNSKRPIQTIYTEADEEPTEHQSITLGNLPNVIHASIASIKKDSDAPVYLNLNLNNQQVSSQASTKKLEKSPSFEEVPKTVLAQPEKPSLRKTFSQSLQTVRAWILNNKLKCFFLGTSGVICGIQGLLWHYARYLSRPQCWSLWQNHTSLASLYQLNQNELIKELLKNLQHHDTLASPPTLIKLFLHQADTELLALNTYSFLVSLGKKWPLKYVLLTHSSLIESLSARITRLSYIKNVAMAWLNLQEHQTTSPTSEPVV